jgi:hypothetical protein
MLDETCTCPLVSIELTAFLSSSHDLAVLTGPCKERRDREQLRQGDGIHGIHTHIFGDHGADGKMVYRLNSSLNPRAVSSVAEQGTFNPAGRCAVV